MHVAIVIIHVENVSLQAEEEREREMKQLEVARYQQEMKLAQKEAEEEKIRRKQAYLKWVQSHAPQEFMHVHSTSVICCIAFTDMRRWHKTLW